MYPPSMGAVQTVKSGSTPYVREIKIDFTNWEKFILPFCIQIKS